MSWLTDLAGRAEDLLNKLDTEAATVLQKEKLHPTTSTSKHSYSLDTSTPPPVKYDRSGLQTSASVPNNLSSFGEGVPAAAAPPIKPLSGPPALGSSPRTRKGNTKKKENSKDEVLINFLNSPLQPDSEQHQTSTTTTTHTSDPMTSSLTTSMVSSLGHSRQSSTSSHSSLVALSGRGTPASVSNDIESGSCGSGSGGSVNTDCYVTVDTPTDVNISAPSSTDGSTSSNNGLMMSSVDSETTLLRKEVSSLNQEMSQVLRRAKEAEREAGQLRSQMSGMLSQQSSSDRVMRELQQRDFDLQESVRAKDSQLAVLRVRLQEADQNIQAKDATLSALQEENKRLMEGASESSGLHSQALQTLEERLIETQSTLDQERTNHTSQHTHLVARVNQLEEEQQSVSVVLVEAQKRLEEEKTRSHQLSAQLGSLRGELASAREELVEYKAKAGRILQSKEKLIATLKEEKGEGTGDQDSDFHQAELQQIQCERDLLREELEGAGGRIQKLMVEVSELEASAQDQATRAVHDTNSLEEVITQERTRRTESEVELRQVQEEVRCSREELTRQKVSFSSRLHDRDTEIDRLRKQVAHKQSSSSSLQELEQRVHGLTESLIHKQTTIETLSTEKHSLIIQMERLQQQYDESQKLLNRDPPTMFRQDEVRNRVPSFLMESPFDGGVTRGVKRAYSTLDKFSVRLGVFLRRYPIARVFVIVYMCILHLWVMVVLLTYTPEIHGPEYHRPIATLPHDQ
ncbi:hypothetical protein Pmani_036944 [Petrolisthes manimaculis]|uniref:Golgin-84 n=1 Tax=Petrolisthes manimaculis TaxID=1843537 RepID=A0AAE1NIR9_9EUCA|nr:hypothetical protein Pmani_036944 [Petrolisthes manimaculis]